MPDAPNIPTAPPSAKASGRRLWKSVVTDFDLEEHELILLRQAVTVVDRLDALDNLVASDGLMVSSHSGPKLHPAAVESRQLKIALARLLAVLRLPAGEAGDQQMSARPQRRVGARGAYGIRGAVK